MIEQTQRYQKYLSEIETLQDHIKHDQCDYEAKRNSYEQQIQKRKQQVEELKSDYVHFNQQGYHLMAERFYTLLKENGAFN